MVPYNKDRDGAIFEDGESRKKFCDVPIFFKLAYLVNTWIVALFHDF